MGKSHGGTERCLGRRHMEGHAEFRHRSAKRGAGLADVSNSVVHATVGHVLVENPRRVRHGAAPRYTGARGSPIPHGGSGPACIGLRVCHPAPPLPCGLFLAPRHRPSPFPRVRRADGRPRCAFSAILRDPGAAWRRPGRMERRRSARDALRRRHDGLVRPKPRERAPALPPEGAAGTRRPGSPGARTTAASSTPCRAEPVSDRPSNLAERARSRRVRRPEPEPLDRRRASADRLRERPPAGRSGAGLPRRAGSRRDHRHGRRPERPRRDGRRRGPRPKTRISGREPSRRSARRAPARPRGPSRPPRSSRCRSGSPGIRAAFRRTSCPGRMRVAARRPPGLGAASSWRPSTAARPANVATIAIRSPWSRASWSRSARSTVPARNAASPTDGGPTSSTLSPCRRRATAGFAPPRRAAASLAPRST